MIKRILTMLILVGFSLSKVSAFSPPDEGMWLPMLIGKNYEQMKKLGLKLTPEQIYNVNNASLKDAIVSLQFCSGSFISPDGLMLTNHHCAFSSIQYHSSVDHDYLTDGFWAMKKSDEKYSPEITASVLVRMEDVTKEVKAASDDQKAAVMKKIETESVAGTHYKGFVKEMYAGGEYYLFVYEVFTDVRLVGAPPSSIGKFGGDTDNWMWPRHTGDFSLFRVYAGADNKPAAYSDKNVPYKPKQFLPVNMKGIQPNDYSMIFGFPGRTERYQTASQIQFAVEDMNPMLIKLFGLKLETMKKDMDADAKIRIQLADKYASLANSYKYYIGQNEGLKRLKLVDYKKAEEEKFLKWVNGDANRKTKYGTMLGDLTKAIADFKPFSQRSTYLTVGLLSPEIVSLGTSFYRLHMALKNTPDKADAIKAAKERIKGRVESFFKDYSLTNDKKLFAAMMLVYYNDIPKDQHPKFFKDIFAKFKGKTPELSINKYLDDAYKKSNITTKEKILAFVDKSDLDLKQIEADPIIKYAIDIITEYYGPVLGEATQKIGGMEEEVGALYIEGLREMNPDKLIYPDANSTPRITYGKVIDYKPKDGVQYQYFCTMKGIIEKYVPKDEEFDVPKKLIDLYNKKDFGIYGANGDLPVSFITDNDITGGNSGSSVVDAEGQLIGLAFDGNWEAMTGDLVYDAEYKRCINVDIRYVLFIIDKFAGAKHLVDEMKLVR